jgi:hypothetical protein
VLDRAADSTARGRRRAWWSKPSPHGMPGPRLVTVSGATAFLKAGGKGTPPRRSRKCSGLWNPRRVFAEQSGSEVDEETHGDRPRRVTSMNANRFRQRAVVVAIAVCALAQAALAVPPEIFTFSVDRTFMDTQLCGFPIELHDEGTFRIAFHLDKEGHIQWVNVTTSQYRVTLTNLDTGVSLWTPSPEHIIETAFDTTNSGLVARFVLPRVGLLTLDAGLVNFQNDGDVTVSGPHMLLEGDVEALCAALGD